RAFVRAVVRREELGTAKIAGRVAEAAFGAGMRAELVEHRRRLAGRADPPRSRTEFVGIGVAEPVHPIELIIDEGAAMKASRADGKLGEGAVNLFHLHWFCHERPLAASRRRAPGRRRLWP